MTEERKGLSRVLVGTATPDSFAKSLVADLLKCRAEMSTLASTVLSRLSTAPRILIEGVMTAGKSTLAGLLATTGRIGLSADASMHLLRSAVAMRTGMEQTLFYEKPEVVDYPRDLNLCLIRGFKYPCVIEGWGFAQDVGMITANDCHEMVLIRPFDGYATTVLANRSEWIKASSDPKKFAESHFLDTMKRVAPLTHSSLYGKYSSFWVRSEVGNYHLMTRDEAENFTKDPTISSVINAIAGQDVKK